MAASWLNTLIGTALLAGERYLWFLRFSEPPPDPYSDGQAGIGIVSLFLLQGGIALVAFGFLMAQMSRMAIHRDARTKHGYINIVLLAAIPVLFLTSSFR